MLCLSCWRDCSLRGRRPEERGELGRGGVPYFYDGANRFDANAAAFLLGKRRMFDLVVKYLALDECEVFRLAAGEKRSEDEIKEEMDV